MFRLHFDIISTCQLSSFNRLKNLFGIELARQMILHAYLCTCTCVCMCMNVCLGFPYLSLFCARIHKLRKTGEITIRKEEIYHYLEDICVIFKVKQNVLRPGFPRFTIIYNVRIPLHLCIWNIYLCKTVSNLASEDILNICHSNMRMIQMPSMHIYTD